MGVWLGWESLILPVQKTPKEKLETNSFICQDVGL